MASAKVISNKGALCSLNDDHMKNIDFFSHPVTDSEVASSNIDLHNTLSGGSRVSENWRCLPQKGNTDLLFCKILGKYASK